jgi:phosphatidylethanolamine-binding protein (PEBP) family uncharacterized protein
MLFTSTSSAAPTRDYHLRLAAVDVPHLDVPASATAEDIWLKAQAYTVAKVEVVGVYGQ